MSVYSKKNLTVNFHTWRPASLRRVQKLNAQPLSTPTHPTLGAICIIYLYQASNEAHNVEQ